MEKLKCQINDKAQMTNQIQMTKWQIRAICEWGLNHRGHREEDLRFTNEEWNNRGHREGFLNEEWKVESRGIGTKTNEWRNTNEKCKN